jgi:DNA polymerase (family 10)
VPGLGPKKAAVLHTELGIDSLDQLAAACKEQRVRDLKGFGAKTEATILKGLAIAKAADDRMLWAKADEIVQTLLAHMEGCQAIKKMSMAGSYRRGRDTVGDLDLLVVSADTDQVMDHFAAFDSVSEVLVRGGTKMSVRVNSKVQVDLRVVPMESFGAALQYFTGSKEHNVVIRGLAKQRGLKINEYGVYRTDGDDEQYVAGASEEDVYATLDLPCFPPELRESRLEFDLAAAGELPELITLEDIRGDLHMHTTETDGKASLREMIAAARARGLVYVAITDHSRRVSMANGLDPKRLVAQWKEVDALNKECGRAFTVLKGIECDILEAGGMDLPDDILAQADWVLASVHYGQKQSRQQITQRILGAIDNPHVTAIAHPTGRLLNKREPYEVDMDAVFAAAKKQGKLLELNANPYRLDLHDTHCAAAKQHGIPIVISTDAHSIAGLDVMRYGVLQARRGGLTKHDVANTRTWAQLRSLLGKE